RQEFVMTTMRSKYLKRALAQTSNLIVFLLVQAGAVAFAQGFPDGQSSAPRIIGDETPNGRSAAGSTDSTEPALVSAASAIYRDPVQGVSSNDLVRRALASNGEIAAARLDIERARARLLQAGLKPNPVIAFQQGSEPLVRAGPNPA